MVLLLGVIDTFKCRTQEAKVEQFEFEAILVYI